MRVLFLKDYRWKPAARKGLSAVSYKAGSEFTVPREAGEAAIRVGAAEEIKDHARKPKAE